MFKNPRLNSYVYILTCVDGEPYCINKTPVYMKNKEAFIPQDALDDGSIDEYRVEQYFNDYNTTWFSNIKSIRNYIKENWGNKYKIEKYCPDMWNIEEKGE